MRKEEPENEELYLPLYTPEVIERFLALGDCGFKVPEDLSRNIITAKECEHALHLKMVARAASLKVLAEDGPPDLETRGGVVYTGVGWPDPLKFLDWAEALMRGL